PGRRLLERLRLTAWSDPLRDARLQHTLVREPLGSEGGQGRLRRLGWHLVPGLSGDRLPVPSTGELREAEQLRRPEEHHAGRAALAVVARAKRRPVRRPGLGVLLPLRGRAAAVDLWDGASCRSASAVRRWNAPRRPDLHLGFATGLQDGPVADPLGPGGPVDPAVRL